MDQSGLLAASYGAAWTLISETSVRLFPAVWPSVEIHTSRCDVGCPAGTAMVLVPGLSRVGPVSRVVSSRVAGLADEAERI